MISWNWLRRRPLATGEAFPWGGVELFDKSRGGDETRHKYRTHSEWHADSKFVGLLKVGYQTSILEIKFKKDTL